MEWLMAIILLTLMNPFFVRSFIWKWSKLCFVYVCWTVASVSTTRVPPSHATPPSPHPLPPSPPASTPRPLTCRTSNYPADDTQMAHPLLADATSQLHATLTSVIPTSHTRHATHLCHCTGLSLADSPFFFACIRLCTSPPLAVPHLRRSSHLITSWVRWRES